MPKKVDANQQELVALMRQLGATVQHLHEVGRGCPDVLVGYRGVNLAVEIKDGEKPPSRQRLTPDEQAWHQGWAGQVCVVRDAADVIQLLTGTSGTS